MCAKEQFFTKNFPFLILRTLREGLLDRLFPKCWHRQQKRGLTSAIIFLMGLSTSMSITILALLSATLVRGASEVDGYALGGYFKRKVAKSGEPCRQQGISFIPLAADKLGGWHSVAIEQIQKLGRALARQSGEDEDKTIRHLFQKLSLLLMSGNSALLLNRVH